MNSLRILRAASHMSLRELGEMVGVSASAISRWENGLTEPSDEALAKRAFRLAAARVPNPKLVQAVKA